MKPKSFCSLSLGLFAIAILAIFGCNNGGKFQNAPPSNLTVTPSKCYVESGGTVLLVGSAHDDDGDSLTFSWRATAGSFSRVSSSGDTVYWYAPAQTGQASITMTVSDDIDKRSLSKVITTCTPLPASILTSYSIENTGAVYILLNSNPLRIPAGVTLTIKPGVTIIVDKVTGGIEVYGRLVALGTPQDSITIRGNTCYAVSGIWGGIYLQDQDCVGTLKYMNVTMSSDGIKLSNGAKGTIEGCSIYNNEEYGIYVEFEGTEATVRSCKIWENGRGIYVLNAKADILKSSIRYSGGDGIDLSFSLDSTQVQIDSCTVANNGQRGIQLSEKAAPEIHYCSIFSNGENPMEPNYGLALGSYVKADSIHAERNFWGLGNTTAAKISALIYDARDNPFEISAFVRFAPWLDSAPVVSMPMDEERTKGRAWAR